MRRRRGRRRPRRSRSRRQPLASSPWQAPPRGASRARPGLRPRAYSPMRQPRRATRPTALRRGRRWRPRACRLLWATHGCGSSRRSTSSSTSSRRSRKTVTTRHATSHCNSSSTSSTSTSSSHGLVRQRRRRRRLQRRRLRRCPCPHLRPASFLRCCREGGSRTQPPTGTCRPGRLLRRRLCVRRRPRPPVRQQQRQGRLAQAHLRVLLQRPLSIPAAAAKPGHWMLRRRRGGARRMRCTASAGHTR
mmetsp:Transcript_29195/g.86403  ORF Transcript_29195/g.86403 Transcript_29195/m.86403 type:complete len:247 (-) Transcript_29195:1236-1976(-)